MPFSCLVFFKMTCLQIQQQPAYNSEPTPEKELWSLTNFQTLHACLQHE